MSALRRTVTAQGVTHSIGSPLPATLAIAPDGVDETAICSVHPRVADAQPASMPAAASKANSRNMDTPQLPLYGQHPTTFSCRQLGRYRETTNIPPPWVADAPCAEAAPPLNFGPDRNDVAAGTKPGAHKEGTPCDRALFVFS